MLDGDGDAAFGQITLDTLSLLLLLSCIIYIQLYFHHHDMVAW